MLSPEILRRAAELSRVAAAPVAYGRVREIRGLLVEASAPGASLGDMIEIETGGAPVLAEVVGFAGGGVLSVPLGQVTRIAPGARARVRPRASSIPVGPALLGRLVDPFGQPLDGGPPIACRDRAPIDNLAPQTSARSQVDSILETGVRVIDGLLTCGRGQRVGIFAGAGVGKSVLVEQIARQVEADVVVVGLIGERGREVRELCESARRDSMVIVAATSDRSPMERTRGARAATAVAEHFCDRGANVVLILDSLTRYAMALREIGLAIGEPPATKGYPPSVFAELPRLLERVAPMAHGGSITGFYTVLVEGDDLSDPVADSARSLLDGHIVLSRELAGRGQFPAVDVLASASRVLRRVCHPDAGALGIEVRKALSQRRVVEELQSLGAYVPGNNPASDRALAVGERLDAIALQAPDERSSYADTLLMMQEALS